jgi:mycothiol system anti-sigma-R factor
MGDAEAHCREVVERVFLYIDGEMDATEIEVIRRHVELCARCHQHTDFEVEIKRIVREKCSEARPPDVLVERVRAFLRGIS